MPTRVFQPISSNKVSPRDSKENSKTPSREVTPRTAAAENLVSKGLKDDYASSRPTSREQTTRVLRVGTIKPSTFRRNEIDPFLIPLDASLLEISPRNKATASAFAQKSLKHREHQIKQRDNKFDLKQPLIIEKEVSSVSSTPQAKHIGAKVHDVNTSAQRLGSVAKEADDEGTVRVVLAAEDDIARFKQSLSLTREQLFTVEPPHEKKLFHWVNHVAEMETMEPVAVDTYFKLCRVSGWRDKQRTHRDTQDSEIDSDITDLFDESKNETVFSNMHIRTSSLPAGRDLYEETIPGVFDSSRPRPIAYRN